MDVKDNSTKERLLSIAKEEFLRYGYSDVSMRDISKATGMALGNIYYYYRTKDERYKNSLVVDPNDQTYTKNKCYVPYEVNVKTKTGRILPLPASTGWAANAIIKVGDDIFFGEQSEHAIGFYKYNMSTKTGSDKPTITTPTGAHKVISLD